MADYTDLELSLHRHDDSAYAVELRFSQPDSDADIRLGPGAEGQLALAQFDLDALRQLVDPVAYGRLLTQGLFADPAVQTAWAQARASTETAGAALRFKLLIGPSAPELHRLRWETLRDPQKPDVPLCTSENLLFSRYLSSLDWRPVRLRPKGALRALVVVANPANLAEYQLAAVDVAGETARAQAGLGDIPVTALPGGDPPRRATLNNLVAALREAGEEGYDILYLVCHGALVKDEPWLWLENDAGQVGRAAGTDLVARLNELSRRPRLMVLASCQSAAPGTGPALAALGPRLAESGIPAVVAMQDSITLETVAQFMPVFFEELRQEGQIDRALAAARGAVRDRPDYWMPVLFMRLKSGRIWYVPGFGDERKGFEKWPALVRAVKKGQCTPILGPGLTEPLLGSTRDLARRWAETYHYPMQPHEREDLPQVAQFLAINQDRGFPRDELEEAMRQELTRRQGDDLPANLRSKRTTLDDLVAGVGEKRWEGHPLDPHKVLAALPLPIYITTNPDSLLLRALQLAGKAPQAVLCPWNEYVEQTDSIYDKEPNYQPTPEKPLVYYLFGRLSEPDSLVLTEDDYFDFLIGVTGNKDLIPVAVRRALTDTALLFVGFQMDSWSFRVLFRSILAGQGGGRRSRYAHIAAQVEPEEGRILEPERARRYLETYFAKGADISLYWGSPEDFAAELQAQWAKAGG